MHIFPHDLLKFFLDHFDSC